MIEQHILMFNTVEEEKLSEAYNMLISAYDYLKTTKCKLYSSTLVQIEEVINQIKNHNDIVTKAKGC